MVLLLGLLLLRTLKSAPEPIPSTQPTEEVPPAEQETAEPEPEPQSPQPAEDADDLTDIPIEIPGQASAGAPVQQSQTAAGSGTENAVAVTPAVSAAGRGGNETPEVPFDVD